MKITKCNKCGKTLKPGDSLLETQWITGNIRGEKPGEWIFFDLCEKCSKKLIKFVKNYLPEKKSKFN